YCVFSIVWEALRSTLFPYTTLFRSARLKRGGGGHIENFPLPPPEHAGEKRLGQPGERFDVQPDHFPFPLPVRLRKRTVHTDSGVVDQDVNLDPRFLQDRKSVV